MLLVLGASIWLEDYSRYLQKPICWWEIYRFPESCALKRIYGSLADLPQSDTGSWVRWGAKRPD
jgi:hypothetical protein